LKYVLEILEFLKVASVFCPFFAKHFKKRQKANIFGQSLKYQCRKYRALKLHFYFDISTPTTLEFKGLEIHILQKKNCH